MIKHLELLIHALRDEMQQYGEMLALLDSQQELVVTRAADDVLQTVSAIQAQNLVIQEVRSKRDECREHLSIVLKQPADAPFEKLIPLLPEEYRPLLTALVEENNELIRRIQQRARQNHLLLSRTIELMQKFMSTLTPAFNPRLYNGTGSSMLAGTPRHSLFEAVG